MRANDPDATVAYYMLKSLDAESFRWCKLMQPESMAAGRLAVSAIIVTVLGLQIVAGFVDTGRWGWPFVAYPMYKWAHYEGERFDHDLTAYLIMDDASERVVTGPDLGLSFWLVEKRLWNPIRNGDPEQLKSFAEDICRKFAKRVVAVRLEDKGVALGRSGMVDNLPPGVVGSMPIRCD